MPIPKITAAIAAQVAGEVRFFTTHARLAQANLLLASDRWSEALEQARLIQRDAPGFRLVAIDARRIEGQALAGLDRWDQAEALLRQAKAEAVSLQAEPPRWRACLALADLLEARGRPDQARGERTAVLERLELVAADLSEPLLAQSLRASPPFERARRGGPICR